jgi:uncharacterized membrane protein
MTKRFTMAERMLILSMAFTILLLVFRIFYSGTLNYIFLSWNLFLAGIPVLFSRKLMQHNKFTMYTALLFTGWLLFFPNAPYVITDIIHYRERWPVPKWYDLLLVTSAAWNGLAAGFISLLQVEIFFSRFLSQRKLMLLVFSCLFLCGYGIYIGRFLRYNSWDIISSPLQLAGESVRHFVSPLKYFRVWEFTLLFSVMLSLFYFTIRSFSLNTDNKANA